MTLWIVYNYLQKVTKFMVIKPKGTFWEKLKIKIYGTLCEQERNLTLNSYICSSC